MKVEGMAVALTALVALAPAAAFAPSAKTGTSIRRSRALAQKSRQTCAPERPHPGFPGVGVLGPSALFGTGPSFTEVVSDTDDEGDDGEEGDEEGGKKKKKKSKKEKVKLEPEVTFFEGSPDVSEVAAPAVSILTVIGIVPFTAALARQAWVKYTITSRRIKIVSGWAGKDTTEVVYQDIVDMRYVWRFFGRCGDVVLSLRDGSKLEVRSLPDFERNYNYILSRTSASCQADSKVITKSGDAPAAEE